VSTACLGVVFVFAAITRERAGERVLPWTSGQAAPLDIEPSDSFVEIFVDLLRALLLPMSLVLIGVEFLSRVAAGIAVSIYPILAVQELGYTSAEYAYWFGVMGGVSAFAGLLFGPLVDRFGARRLLMAGLVCGALTALAFATLQSMWGEMSVVLTALVFSNLSSQLVFVAIIATFMGTCWVRVAATQFAVYMSLSNLSRSIGAGVFASIAADVTSAQAIYMIAVLLMCAAVLLVLFDPAKHALALGRLAND